MGEVDGVEVGIYDGDAVVVLAGGITLDGQWGEAGGGQLEDAAELLAHGVHVAVDDDYLGIAVAAHHVAEETLGGMDAMAENKDATGCADGF